MNYKKEDVLKKVKLSEVADLLEIEIEKTGKGYKANCPFPGHDDNKPSFILYDNEDNKNKRGFWECKVCGFYGDMFELVMKLRKYSFDEAVNFIGDNFDRVAPIEMSPEEKRRLAIKKVAIPVLEECALYFRTNLNADIYEYLEKERGLDRNSIERFEIGFAPNDARSLKTHLFNKGFSREDLLMSGVFKEKNSFLYPIIQNKIVFPLRDQKGDMVGFNSRKVPWDENENKYILTFSDHFDGKTGFLYGLYQSRKRNLNNSHEILIVEGVMDVIQVFKETDRMAVSILGSTIQTEAIGAISKYLEVKNIYLALDGDESGQKGTRRFIENFHNEVLSNKTSSIEFFDTNISVMQVSQGKDIDDILREGEVLLDTLIEGSIPFTKYIIQKFSEDYNLKHPHDKDKFIKKALSTISAVGSFTEEIYLGQVSKLSGIDMNHLKEKLELLKIDFISSRIEKIEREVLYYVVAEKQDLTKNQKRLLSRDSKRIVDGDFENFSTIVRYMSVLDYGPDNSFERAIMILRFLKMKKLVSSFESLPRSRRKYIAENYNKEVRSMYKIYKRAKQELL